MAVLTGTYFFTVEVLTWRGLVTYYVLFFIHLESRRVNLAGLTRHPFIQQGRHELCKPARHRHSDREAGQRQTQTSSQNHRQDVARPRAERYPDPHPTCALLHRAYEIGADLYGKSSPTLD